MIRGMAGAAAALLLALAGCRQAPTEAIHPALWEVRGPRGEQAWLFGTVHALPGPVEWKSPAIGQAIRDSDVVVVEISNSGEVPALFARLSRTPGQPPLSQRVSPRARKGLADFLEDHSLSDGAFSDMETWAAALTLSRAAQGSSNSKWGVENLLLRAARLKPVEEIEGAAEQLGIFDGLPETEQRDLLEAVLSEAADRSGGERLYTAWSRGDVPALTRATQSGLLADPELREALLVRRNRVWTDRIVAILGRGRRPLVAVGAGHMVGADGLPAMLAAKGYEVKRLQ